LNPCRSPTLCRGGPRVSTRFPSPGTLAPPARARRPWCRPQLVARPLPSPFHRMATPQPHCPSRCPPLLAPLPLVQASRRGTARFTRNQSRHAASSTSTGPRLTFPLLPRCCRRSPPKPKVTEVPPPLKKHHRRLYGERLLQAFSYRWALPLTFT
jgi:hypothetical protein